MEKKLLSVLFPVLIFFLSSWSGFGQECPTSVSISADPGNIICENTTVTFTASANGGTGTLSYQWQINEANQGSANTTNTFSPSTLSNGDKIRVIVTSSDDATCSTTSSGITMTVNSNKTPTVSITADKTSICPGESVTFTASNTNGGTSPQYAFYLNNNTSALQTGSANKYSTTSLNNGDYIRVVLTSSLECVTSKTAEANSNTITVRAGTPETPGTIETSTGTEICPGTSQTYSISSVTGATSYQWTLPSGWSGSSTSTSINATAGTSGGTISVKAINDCGTSEAQTVNINVKPGTPVVPETISGETAVCPGVQETYSITAVANATEYVWTLPNGQEQVTQDPSITVTTNTSGNSDISVKARNECGTSEAKALSVSVKPGTPDQPDIISGTTAVCPGVSETYSITAVTGATSYEWILPDNSWTGTSTTNSITVTTGTTNGNISVKAVNDCGISTEQILALTVKPGTPATPGAISGSDIVCPATSEIYSIIPIDGATEYIWTLPNGWSGSSTTEEITVTTGDSGSGNITVKAKNDCGTSTAASFSVSVDKPAPVMTGTVTGDAEVCSTATGLVYSIPAITNAAEYLWNLPAGWDIIKGSGTNSITVNASSNSGDIFVIAKNTCGESAPSANFAITSTTGIPATPGEITTSLPSTAICPPVYDQTFSVTPVTGATGYIWTLPTGWEIVSGANTSSITVNITAAQSYESPTTVKVQATNICGDSGVSTSQDIFLDNYIIANIGPDLTVCQTLNPIPQVTLNGTMSFGNANLSPEFTTSGSGTFQNIPSNKKGDFTLFYTPSQADYNSDQIKITMTIPQITQGNTTSCGTGKDEMIIFFKPLPTATITSTSPVCEGNSSTVTFTGTPNSRVTYQINNGTNQTIDIDNSGTATLDSGALTTNTTYTLISSINLDTPECSNSLSGSTTVTVTPKPTADISYAGPFCSSLSNAQEVTLTGTHAYTGGIFTSTEGLAIDSSSGAITPSNSTPGTYTVTYNTPEAGDCAEVTATTEVTITKEPTATISYSATSFCTSDSDAKPVTLEGTDNYTGGKFTAPEGLTIDASTGAITASSSAANTYTVTYETLAAGGCSPITTTTEVTITKAPTATIEYAGAPFCHSETSAQAVTLTGTDAFSGGTFTAPAGLSINASTGAITPASSNLGTYEVTYTTPASAGCGEVTAITSITITETPAAEISYSGPYCTSDATAHLPQFTNTSGVYEGGVYRSTPDGLAMNTTTGEIIAQNSSPNTYTVFYELPAGAGCGTSEIQTSVTITQVPQLELSYTSPLCNSDTSSYPVTFSTNAIGAYQNGTFTGTPGLAIDSEGNINASNSTPGIHTVTYTTPEANGCGPVEVTTNVEIFEQVVITSPPVNIGICSTEPASFEVVASGDNLTYEWKRVDGAAITNATGVNTSKLSFSNATATNAGEYFVEITGSSPCTSVSSEPVTLNVDENIVIIKPTEDITFCDQEREGVTFEFIAHANGAELQFTWIKDGADISNENTDRYTFITTGITGTNGEYSGTMTISNPNPADNGVYAVRINGPDYFTCSEATSKTFTLDITPLPEPPTTEPVVLCQGETAEPLSASGANGATFKWYTSTMEPIEGVPTPSTVDAGNTSYYVTQITEVCESNPTELVVTVNPTPELPQTTEAINYCFEEENVPALSATSTDANAVFNWYGPNDATLVLSAAPTPITTSTGNTKYWVSQSLGECESELVEIVVTIDPLPELAVSADSQIICAGSSTTLRATGADTYSWTLNGTEIGSTADFSVTPSETTTYVLIGTNNTGCQNVTEITIEVDSPTVPGILTGPESVCINNPVGTLELTGYLGDILKWEYQAEGQTTWEVLNSGNVEEIQQFSGLTGTTIFRATVKNGVCNEEVIEHTVLIDPLPQGGIIAFEDLIADDNDGTFFMICEGATSGYLPLTLSESVGTIVAWKYRSGTGTWVNVPGDGGNFTGNILSASQIQALALSETTVFRVEIESGACTPNTFSETAIISVIPTNIEPKPVTVSEEVVCLGEDVILSSETGYNDGLPGVEGGAFDNAGIKNNGWRFGLDGNDANFETNANNTNQDFWSRATPHDFNTADYDDSPYTMSPQRWDAGNEDGNKGFALVSGDHNATMETNVFAIGSMDQAIVTFDQAYNLTPGATITVEISKDGGATYEEILFTMSGSATSGNYSSFGTGTPKTRPNNKMVFDLGNYLGENNLRIKFTFDGARDGDLWAVDDIKVPDGPRNITIEWNDYTDPDNIIQIGTTNSVTYVPTKIGLNIFEVKTKLIFDSAGNVCDIAENAENIDVFVFDKYTTSVTADYGSCGNFEAQLTATVVNGTNDTIRSYPTPDGYVGSWKIEGSATLMDSNPSDDIAAVNDPNAILSTDATGTYSVSWILEPTAVDENGIKYVNPEECPPVVNPLEVIIEGCLALDFDGENDHIVIDDPYSNVVSIEAWIRPEVAGGTIISGPNFRITTPASVTPNTRWYHIAVSNGKLYIDGIESSDLGLGTGGSKTLIGADWVDGAPTNFFSGWIEEVRLWKTPITQDQIRFMMNQRLQAGANIGEQIPMPAPGALDFTALAGYYRLISANPDPANLVTFEVNLMPANGVTPDLAATSVPGRLINMETNQQNTAPLPYFSANDGLWATDETWARPEVWDPPHTGPIEWNIVRTSNNITSGARDIKVLGLISEVNTLQMDGTYAPSGWNTAGTGNPLYISHYLKLDGVIDLVGESQLIQPNGSIVDAASTGYLERDQQGTANSYNYNYWSSPVSTGTGNVPYTVAGVLKDGTDPANPQTITFGDPYAFADGGKTNPIKISNYWISIFNGDADEYGQWAFQYGSGGAIKVGEGYTMKGTSGPVPVPTAQNYVFAGKPNNGNIPLTVGQEKNYLLGNPYASAISVDEFIKDNLKDVAGGKNESNTFNGALYFWEHFGQKDSHILLEYVGGYATRNLVGGVPAASVDYRIDQTGAFGKKIPGEYISVGQGFFINTALDTDIGNITIHGGELLFQNSQRFFIPDANGDEGDAVFLRPEEHSKQAKAEADARSKIRLGYVSPQGFYRQILVGVDPNTTNGFDLGYDALLNDYNSEDMYWIQDNNWLVIQGVPHFDKEQVLPLGIIVKEKGEFTIQIDKLENIADDKNIYLKDNLLDTVHDLRASSYKVKAEGGFHNDRFEIVFFKEVATDTEPPIVDKPKPDPGLPDGGGIPDDITNLTVRYSHTRQEIQILNPDQVPLSNMYIFDLNGNQLINHRNISHDKDVRVPVRNYSSGVYIVKLYSEGNVVNKKIIINN